MKVSVLEGFIRHAVRLAVLVVFLTGIAASSHAQAAGATAQPATKTVAPAAAQAKTAQPAAPSQRQPGGNHEGIKVHGHWMIEVRNPDGKLVSHTEFENSLTIVGQQSLTDLLLGYSVPGGYRVILANGSDGNGPCATINTIDSECTFVASLISPEPAAFGDNLTGCGGTGFANQITANGPCFPLSISPSGSPGRGLTFSGTAVASTTVPITDVELDPVTCPEPLSTAGGPGSATTSPNACAQSGAAGVASGLTHATLPTPVTISAAGQFISVNVQLSFQ